MKTFVYTRGVDAIAEETLTFSIDEVPADFEEWDTEDQVEYLTDLAEIEYESEILDITEADEWQAHGDIVPGLYLVK